MADFAQFVEAAAPGLGWEPGEFLADYEGNRQEAVAAAAEASPLLPALEAVLGRRGLGPEGFDGTARELLGELREICSEAEQRDRWLPRVESQVGTALRRLAPLLPPRGIVLSHYKVEREKTRMIALRCRSAEVFDELCTRLRGERRPAAGDGPAGPESPPSGPRAACTAMKKSPRP
jgi:putative DNA primase/helicase